MVLDSPRNTRGAANLSLRPTIHGLGCPSFYRPGPAHTGTRDRLQILRRREKADRSPSNQAVGARYGSGSIGKRNRTFAFGVAAGGVSPYANSARRKYAEES